MTYNYIERVDAIPQKYRASKYKPTLEDFMVSNIDIRRLEYATAHEAQVVMSSFLKQVRRYHLPIQCVRRKNYILFVRVRMIERMEKEPKGGKRDDSIPQY